MGDLSAATALGLSLYRPLMACALIALALSPSIDLAKLATEIGAGLRKLSGDPEKTMLARLALALATIIVLPYLGDLLPVRLSLSPDGAMSQTQDARPTLAIIWCAHPFLANPQQVFDYVLEYPLSPDSQTIATHNYEGIREGSFDILVAKAMALFFLLGWIIAWFWKAVRRTHYGLVSTGIRLVLFAALMGYVAYSGFTTAQKSLEYWVDAQIRLVQIEESRHGISAAAPCQSRMLALSDPRIQRPEYRLRLALPTPLSKPDEP